MFFNLLLSHRYQLNTKIRSQVEVGIGQGDGKLEGIGQGGGDL